MVIAERISTKHPVVEAGEQIGINIIIRPWWGSRRTRNNRVHIVCNTVVYDAYNFEKRIVEPWCSNCRQHLPPSEIRVERIRHTWLCPRVRYPQVQTGAVVLWEGDCGIKGHNHRQNIEVLDIDESALLLRLSAGVTGRNFIIGLDDGHPFATAVPRRVITVQDAFDWLVPKLIRQAYILGKEVKRQGDWYFIPARDEPTTRPPHYSDLSVAGSNPALYTNRLYRDVPLIYNGVQTRHTGELVVYKGLINTTYGAPRVKGEIKAPDHPTLILDTWHIGVRRRSGTGMMDEATNPGAD